MTPRNSSHSFKLQALVNIFYRYRVESNCSWRGYQRFRHNHVPPLLPYKLGNSASLDQGLISFTSSSSNAYCPSKVKDQKRPTQPALLPVPTKFGFFNWTKWLFGFGLSMLLSFWKSNRDKLLILEGKTEMIVEDMEMVAEVVEKVASTTDEVLKEIENELPDNSKVKEVAQVMEHISSVAAQDAQLLESVIHKVGEGKKDLKDLEAIVEPLITHYRNKEE